MGADAGREIELTNLGQPLFDGAEATKGDLVAYLDAVADRLVLELRGRPLSVIRALRGRKPFMQKNVPRYTPAWVRTVSIWAEASHREVTYALCDDADTLRWFANQRAVEFHPTLFRLGAGLPVEAAVDEPAAGPPPGEPAAAALPAQTHLVLDLDPPPGESFAAVAATARLVRRALADAGLEGAPKTSGAKGLHLFVPVAQPADGEQIAAATRALAARAARLDPSIATTAYVVQEREGKVFVDATRAGGATVVAAYSPRIRPGTTVSFPVAWDELDAIAPTDFTIHTVPRLLAGANPWAERMPPPQPLPADLVEEGRTIPVARVQAMHEGKRRARARRAQS
jgi:DNA ligase D-like protein (predicted polymerase)